MSIPHLRDAIVVYGLMAVVWIVVIGAFAGGFWLIHRALG